MSISKLNCACTADVFSDEARRIFTTRLFRLADALLPSVFPAQCGNIFPAQCGDINDGAYQRALMPEG